jgi:hypothetical protein
MVGWNLSNALKEIIAAAGIGCEKLEQVGSLFWSMTKKGKKDVDRNNCTLEMTESIEI